jgi:hypothetical protein
MSAAEVHIEGNYAGSLLSAKSRGGMSGPAYDYANKNCVHILTLIGSYLVRSRAQIWQSNPDPNVCPIRFLDQHSPEKIHQSKQIRER